MTTIDPVAPAPEDYRTRTVKNIVVRAEREAINQRTHVGSLRLELAEQERVLGAIERELAEARGLAAELGIGLTTLDLGPGTLRDMMFATR